MQNLSSDTRALLDRVAMVDGPDPQARERVRWALAAAQTAAPAAALTYLAAPKIAGVKVAGVKWMVALALAVSMGAVGVWLREIRQTNQHTNQKRAVEFVATTLSPMAPAVQSLLQRQATNLASSIQSFEASPPRQASRSRMEPGLAEETKLLERARIELRDGRAARSLALVAQHEARFQNGALREERMATQALALCTLSRTSEGRAVAQRFARSFPGSPLLPRVQSVCGQPGATHFP